MGSGSNDLVVLDSNDISANILVIDQTFGKVSVVNFFDDAARTVVGNHAIDFTAYLNNVDSNTGSTLSEDPIPVTLNVTPITAPGSVAAANSVTVDLTTDLVPGTAYYVRVGATAIQDLAGNAFAGITNPGTFNFTTAGDAPPAFTEITLEDLATVDVADGAYKVIVDFAAADGVKLGNINGFGADDLIEFQNAPDGAVARFDSSTATSIDFGFGSLFDDVWVIGMGDLDETLLTDVMAEATAEDQIAVLGAEWGKDWFVLA